jgi:hypothetical protein
MAFPALALAVRELALFFDQPARDADIARDQHIARQRDIGNHPVMHPAKVGLAVSEKIGCFSL